MRKIKRKFRITFNAPVVLSLIFICFIAALLGEITRGESTRLIFMTYHSSLLNPLTYIRFITHVFGHANWNHFIGNATYLLLLGPMLEEKYKSGTLIEIIIITALVTGIINYIFSLILHYVELVGLSLHLLFWLHLPDLRKAKFL